MIFISGLDQEVEIPVTDVTGKLLIQTSSSELMGLSELDAVLI